MNANGYKLLGYAVWRGGKWYLRQRLPSPRRIVLRVGAGASAVLAAAVLARRVAS